MKHFLLGKTNPVHDGSVMVCTVDSKYIALRVANFPHNQCQETVLLTPREARRLGFTLIEYSDKVFDKET